MIIEGGYKMRGVAFAIATGIAILLPMFINYGVNIFSPTPKYPTGVVVWDQAHPEKHAEWMKKSMEYKKQMKRHQQLLFYVAVPAGIAAIIGGSFIAVPAVGPGLVFGGVFTLIEGYWFYWSELEDWAKFVSIVIALAALIFTAYRRLAPRSNN
jgi:hypothetical protein